MIGTIDTCTRERLNTHRRIAAVHQRHLALLHLLAAGFRHKLENIAGLTANAHHVDHIVCVQRGQIGNARELILDHRRGGRIVGRAFLHQRLIAERHLVIVLQRCVLLVGRFQLGLRYEVHLVHFDHVVVSVRLLFERGRSDLATLVHQIHAEQFALAFRVAPRTHCRFGRHAHFDNPFVLVRAQTADRMRQLTLQHCTDRGVGRVRRWAAVRRGLRVGGAFRIGAKRGGR